GFGSPGVGPQTDVSAASGPTVGLDGDFTRPAVSLGSGTGGTPALHGPGGSTGLPVRRARGVRPGGARQGGAGGGLEQRVERPGERRDALPQPARLGGQALPGARFSK